MSGWHTALDRKVETVEWLASDSGRRYLAGFTKDIADKKGNEAGQTAFALAAQLEHHTRRSVPMYVHPDLLDLAEVAVESFKPEGLVQEDMITPWCFMSLPRTVLTPDVKGKLTGWSRLSWWPVVIGNPEDAVRQSGIGIALWSTYADWEVDDYGEELFKLAEEARHKGLRPDMSLSLMHTTAWRFGENAPDGLDGASWYSWMQVLMRLSMQTISSHSYETAPRASRRRAQRAGLEDFRDVLVVKLRRASAPTKEHDGETRHLEYRHIVGGHWREQPYPSIGVTRQIWIADYIQGPEDAPLRVHSGKAFELVH